MIQKGDLVGMIPGAVYSTGACVPQWFSVQKWIVTEELDDEFVKLGLNELGSPCHSDSISRKYLVLIDAKVQI